MLSFTSSVTLRLVTANVAIPHIWLRLKLAAEELTNVPGVLQHAVSLLTFVVQAKKLRKPLDGFWIVLAVQDKFLTTPNSVQ
jgi:hypothetical protein